MYPSPKHTETHQMSLPDSQNFYGEIRQAVISFFDLSNKESLPIVGDLLGCLEEEANVLAKCANQPASAPYLQAYDNIATVAKKLQATELQGMLNRLSRCKDHEHAEERIRVIGEMLKRLSGARTLHPF